MSKYLKFKKFENLRKNYIKYEWMIFINKFIYKFWVNKIISLINKFIMLKDEQSLKDLKEYIFIIFRMNYYFDTQDESIIKLTKYRSFCVITHNNKSFRRFKMNRRLLKESISSGVITGFYKASW